MTIINDTIALFYLDHLIEAERRAERERIITLAPHEYRNIPAHIADSAMRKEGA
tara:strand:- start:9862 stop:10023 length:162 start_codon:yes stop_codon:yes gene_type:complete